MFDDFEYRSTRAYLPLFIVGGLLIAFLTGRLTPIHVPDTHSYLEYPFGSLTGIGEAIRTPGYPIWLLFFKSTFGLKFVPAAQVFVHSIAAWAMFRELIRWGMGAWGGCVRWLLVLRSPLGVPRRTTFQPFPVTR